MTNMEKFNKWADPDISETKKLIMSMFDVTEEEFDKSSTLSYRDITALMITWANRNCRKQREMCAQVVRIPVCSAEEQLNLINSIMAAPTPKL